MSGRRSARQRRRSRRAGRLGLPPARPGLFGRTAEPNPTLTPIVELRDAHSTGKAEQGGAHFGLRLSVVAVVVVGLFAALVVRLWSLQVINGSRLSRIAEQTTTRQVPTAPPRGEILTRSGGVLARDVSTEAVTVDPQRAAAHPAVVGRVAALLGLPVSFVNGRLKAARLGLDNLSPFVPVPIATNVAPETVAYIAEHHRELPGVTASPTYERTYPYGSLATQTLGYVGAIQPAQLSRYAKYGYTENDSIGQAGLESQYELALHGKPGIDTVEVDPYGDVVRTVSSSAPVPGDNVVLNLDLGLQQVFSNSLANVIATLRTSPTTPAPWGAGVILDARTGAVLAMSSFPTYNNNWWVPVMSDAHFAALNSAYGNPLNNYAVAGLQPPGSTFKIATATAALQSGLIAPGTFIDDTGTYSIGNPPTILHDADNEALGWVNVTSAIAESSDVFFYTLGGDFFANTARYGQTPIQNMAHRYGLGVATGIDLPVPSYDNGWVDSFAVRRALHQQAPSVYGPPTWYGGDNVEMAFGQGETVVTPIQIATAYATFANGGTRYAPEMAAGIVSPTGRLVRRIAPHPLNHITIAPANYQAMLAGFEGAVQNPKGTAYGAFTGFNFAKWDIAGKTGTGTISLHDVKQPTSWFAAFGGPRGQTPRYAMAVEIYQGGYGANAAAPVIRQAFNYLYQHGIAPLRLPVGR